MKAEHDLVHGPKWLAAADDFAQDEARLAARRVRRLPWHRHQRGSDSGPQTHRGRSATVYDLW